MNLDFRNTYVEIDNHIIEENARILCNSYPHKYNIAVVKGNAYGHGYGVIPALIKGGMNAFAVSNLNEALCVREYTSDCPVIMLQPVHEECFKICSDNNISICINDLNILEAAISSGFSLKIHIKVDSGMNRLGFKEKADINKAVSLIKNNKSLFLEGIFTHFHTSGRIDNEYKANKETFEALTSDIDLLSIPIVHLDRTQTAILHESPAYETGARFGIALFGFPTVYPYSNGIKGKLRKIQFELSRKMKKVDACRPYSELGLKKAFTLYSEVIQVKEVKAGEYVGYGMMHKASSDEYIAVIDIGYADGIGRKRYNTNVSINGKLYRIIGDVGMGMCEVLVDSTVKKYDKVTVFGKEVSTNSVTSVLNTTIYEVMTNIKAEIPRKYI